MCVCVCVCIHIFVYIYIRVYIYIYIYIYTYISYHIHIYIHGKIYTFAGTFSEFGLHSAAKVKASSALWDLYTHNHCILLNRAYVFTIPLVHIYMYRHLFAIRFAFGRKAVASSAL